MDSLDEKQRAFEERMNQEKGPKPVESRLHVDRGELKLGVQNLQKKLDQEYHGKSIPVPEWVSLKGTTIANHMTQVYQLAEQWGKKATSLEITSGNLSSARSGINSLRECARELLVIMNMLTRQIDQDNTKLRELQNQALTKKRLKKKK